MLIHKVGFQFGHSFPTVLESFAFGVGTRCAYELYVRITCLDGLDKRFQTLDSFRGGNALAAIIQVDEDVTVIAHSQFLHV